MRTSDTGALAHKVRRLAHLDIPGAGQVTVAALNDPVTRKALGDLGVDIVGSSPAEFSAYIKAEIPKWRAVVQAAGARLD